MEIGVDIMTTDKRPYNVSVEELETELEALVADGGDKKEPPFLILSHEDGFTYDIYLSNEIKTDQLAYIPLIAFFKNANPQDQIYLFLSNYGGDCQVGFTIAHAVRACPGFVTAVVVAPCYSMGAILALSGHYLVMLPATFLMLHNYSTSEEGKAGEIGLGFKHYQKHFKESIKYFCSPFITTAEMKKLFTDRDVYIHASDKKIPARIQAHFGDFSDE